MVNNSVIINGDDNAQVTLLLAHGAGAGMEHEFMQDIAEQLAAGGVRVIRFNFPYMVKRQKMVSDARLIARLNYWNILKVKLRLTIDQESLYSLLENRWVVAWPAILRNMQPSLA